MISKTEKIEQLEKLIAEMKRIDLNHFETDDLEVFYKLPDDARAIIDELNLEIESDEYRRFYIELENKKRIPIPVFVHLVVLTQCVDTGRIAIDCYLRINISKDVNLRTWESYCQHCRCVKKKRYLASKKEVVSLLQEHGEKIFEMGAQETFELIYNT